MQNMANLASSSFIPKWAIIYTIQYMNVNLILGYTEDIS